MHGGFEMHKFKSNSRELTRLITAPNECESIKSRSEDKDDVTYAKAALGEIQSDCDKMLGMKWNKKEDIMKFDLEEIVQKADKLVVTNNIYSAHWLRFSIQWVSSVLSWC